MKEVCAELHVQQAARAAALQAVVAALVKLQPDRAAFEQSLASSAQLAFEMLSDAIPESLARERELAQQNFDTVISAFVALARGIS